MMQTLRIEFSFQKEQETGLCGYDLVLKKKQGCDNIFNLTVCKCLL